MFEALGGLILFVIVALLFSNLVKRIDSYFFYKKYRKKDKS